MNELSQLARVRDEDLAGRASGAGARTLLAAVTAEEPTEAMPGRPRRPVRVRRVIAGALATAALAAAAVIGPGFLEGGPGSATSYANSAIEIDKRDGQWVARVRDPFADHALYGEAFRAVGLDIRMTLVPASPRGVGKVIQMGFSGDITPGKGIGGDAEPEGCTLGQPGCAMTVRVDEGFTGTAVLSMGRPAKPGEKYESHAPATRKGEMLAGVRVDERTVGEVKAEVDKRGLKAVYQVIEPSPEGNGYGADPDARAESVGDDWVVWEAYPEQDGVVRLLVTEKRLPKNPVYDGPKPAELTSR